MKRQYRKVEEVLDRLTPVQIAAVADIYELGEGLLSISNHETAMGYYKMAAEVGDQYAQSTLANAYAIGCGVEQNDELALYWFWLSAEQGNPYAQYEVGRRLLDCDGALLWLHASAKQGFPVAMKELSDRLRVTDPKRSKKWLKRYYRSKDKLRDAFLLGKKHLRSRKKQMMPKVVDGEVVIMI